MIISYFGKQFVKLSQGDLTIAFNPISKDSEHKDKISRFGSDIALITANHPDFNGVDTVTHGDHVPFLASGPGDYETKEIFIKGLMTETEIEKKKYIVGIAAASSVSMSAVRRRHTPTMPTKAPTTSGAATTRRAQVGGIMIHQTR